jgi:hypothetical protein
MGLFATEGLDREGIFATYIMRFALDRGCRRAYKARKEMANGYGNAKFYCASGIGKGAHRRGWLRPSALRRRVKGPLAALFDF